MVKSHELIGHFIRLYLVPLLPYGQACFELVVTYTIVKLQAVDLKTYLEAMYEWSCVLDAEKVHVSDVVEMLLC